MRRAVRAILPTLAACLFALPAAAAPPEGKTMKSDAPRLRLVAAAADGEHWSLVFEAANPGDAPVPYFGYRSDSYAPPLKDGTISPLYRIELRSGGKWAENRQGWCGTGVGPVSLPPKGKATFAVHVPKGDWDGLKVGLAWWPSAERKGPASVAWSDPVTAADLEKRPKR